MSFHMITKSEQQSNGLGWLEDICDYDIKERKDDLLYIVDDQHCTDYHRCNKSVLYNDMTGYEDLIQREGELKDDEFYVVLYNKPVKAYGFWELWGAVDFGVTKEDIIKNVLDNKYAEGAYYFTVGQMMKTTLDYQNGVHNG